MTPDNRRSHLEGEPFLTHNPTVNRAGNRLAPLDVRTPSEAERAVYSVVTAHLGGKGTTLQRFICRVSRLPLLPAAATPVTHLHPSTRKVATETLLLVEDDPICGELTQRSL